MNHPIDEPLTPEERALAERLARLGPHDGPSPALDAKILAAAHAAVAPPRRRPWLAISSVPASLVTGVGMAAVLALAVGVVWQLRPSAPAPQAPRDEAADMGYVSAEILQRADKPAAPPPPPPVQAPVPQQTLQPPAMAKRQAAPAIARSQAAPAQASAPVHESSEHFLDEAVSAAHGTQGAAAEVQRQVAPFAAPAAAPPAPAAPPADAVMTISAAEEAGRARAAAAAGAAQRKAVANDMQRRSAETRALAAPAARAEAADAAIADTAATSEPAPAPELDSIQVTGSRIAAVDGPVRNDRELAPEAWLERIRARRDGGDLDGARESLILFRKAHPSLRLPDDLRALAAPTR